jgi:diguanylate cyclase (GGDEF)-like protein
MSGSRAPRVSPGTIACGVLSVVALVTAVIAAATDTAGLAVVAGITGAAAGALGVVFDRQARRAEESLWQARAQTRHLRRRVDELEAALSEEHSVSAGVRAAGAFPDDLPAGTDTSEWEIDPVSGLLRDHYLPVLLQQAVAAARRKVVPLSVVFWELDGLAEATDDARDQALTALAAVAWRTLRESDSVFRLGPVVAVAVLADTAEPGAVTVAERVREALRESPVGDSLTVSAGIACYPTHALDAAELVSRAGRALEDARAHGHLRNHVAVAPTD